MQLQYNIIDKSWKRVHYKATDDVNKVYQYLCNRNLTVNENKTMFMIFSINKIVTNQNLIYIHGYVDGFSCYHINKCLTIKEVTRN